MKKVEATIQINVPPQKVIQAFVNAEMLRGWWSVERALVQPKVGGLYTLAWGVTEKGFAYVTTGSIQSYKPDSELVIGNLVYMNPERMLFGPMSLTVKAAPSGSGTELYLCQDGYQQGADWDWYYEAVKSAWPAVLKTLKEYLEKQ